LFVDSGAIFLRRERHLFFVVVPILEEQFRGPADVIRERRV